MMRLFSGVLLGIASLAGTAFAEGTPQVMNASITKESTKIFTAWGNKAGRRCCWYPKASIFVKMPDAADDDVLVIQHMQAKKAWGKPEKCSPKEINKVDGVPVVRFECEGTEAMMIDKPGQFGARLTYKNTKADKTFADFATLSYSVKKYNAGGGKKPDTGFTVDYDFHMGEAWLQTMVEGPAMNTTDEGPDESEPQRARIVAWFKFEDKDKDGAFKDQPTLRCSFNGKQVGEAKAFQLLDYEYVYYDKKNDHIKVGWEKHAFSMSSLWVKGPTKPSPSVTYPPETHDMSKNPGEYTCKVTYEGDVIREFAFTVDKDGNVVKSDCQKDLVLPATLTLIRQTKVAGDAKYDQKAFGKGAFYGQKWSAGCPK